MNNWKPVPGYQANKYSEILERGKNLISLTHIYMTSHFTRFAHVSQ